jgi:hypothetical protein
MVRGNIRQLIMDIMNKNTQQLKLTFMIVSSDKHGALNTMGPCILGGEVPTKYLLLGLGLKEEGVGTL